MIRTFIKSRSSFKILFLILLLSIAIITNFNFVVDSMARFSASSKTMNDFGYIRGATQRVSQNLSLDEKNKIIKTIDEKFSWLKRKYIDSIPFSQENKKALLDSYFVAYEQWRILKDSIEQNNQTKIAQNSKVLWVSTNNLVNFVEKIEENNHTDFNTSMAYRMVYTFSVIIALFIVVWFSVRGVLERNVIRDALTSLFNRYYFMKQIAHFITIFKRYNEPLSLIFVDVDFFKNINDTYGHQVGDEVLIELASMIKADLRESDSAYRYGGEEFVVISTRTNAKEALVLAERFRKKIEEHAFDKVKKVTLSLGITELKESDDVISLIKRADDAMYLAKSAGRNQVKTVL